MDPSVSLSSALAGCQGIQAQDAQGDCMTAALELREGTGLKDCEQIESERWRNECIFVLAERQSTSDLPGAVALCEQSRYARECLFHLIRDVAQTKTDLAADQAEGFIEPFVGVTRVPDSAALFWKEWVRYKVRTMDQAVPEGLCEGLVDVESCTAGVVKARKEMVRGEPSAERCKRVEEELPLLQLEDGTQALALTALELEEIRRTCAASKR
jgi:hypothetical protein